MTPQPSPERLLALAKMGDRAAADELRRLLDRIAPRQVSFEPSLKAIIKEAQQEIAKSNFHWPAGGVRISLVADQNERSMTLIAQDTGQTEEGQYTTHLERASLTLTLSRSADECLVSMSSIIEGRLYTSSASGDGTESATVEEVVRRAGDDILRLAVYSMRARANDTESLWRATRATVKLLNATGIVHPGEPEAGKPRSPVPLGDMILRRHTAGRNVTVNVYAHPTPQAVGQLNEPRWSDGPGPDIIARISEMMRSFTREKP